MPTYKQRRRARYEYLLSNWFTPFEARSYSVLPKRTPALQRMIKERVARREKFEQVAGWRVRRGLWRPQDVGEKWVANLQKLYREQGWVVQHGPKGAQRGPGKGAPSPWAEYRYYERRTPPKRYISPWETKRYKGAPSLDRGVLMEQRAKREDGVSQETLRRWIGELSENIEKAKGERRQELIARRERLSRQLED